MEYIEKAKEKVNRRIEGQISLLAREAARSGTTSGEGSVSGRGRPSWSTMPFSTRKEHGHGR
jgi:hypothetical protein